MFVGEAIVQLMISFRFLYDYEMQSNRIKWNEAHYIITTIPLLNLICLNENVRQLSPE